MLLITLYYLYIQKHHHQKFQLIYYLNNEYYNKDNHNHKKCPRGCNKEKKCLYPDYCYNSSPYKSVCCVDDTQCKDC